MCYEENEHDNDYDSDYAADEFYDRISKELYPEHRDQAISEFIEEKMRLYYQKNKNIIFKAPIDIYKNAESILTISTTGAFIMYSTVIELLFREVIVKPLLCGMIHSENENITKIIIDSITKKKGAYYSAIISPLCLDSTKINLAETSVNGKKFWIEESEIRKIRNNIVHQGSVVSKEDAIRAETFVKAVFDKAVSPIFLALEVEVDKEFLEILK